MAKAGGAVIKAANEGMKPAVSVLDDPGFAMHEDVVGIARNDANLHPPG